MESVEKRFLRYVSVDTQSNDSSSSCPSTPGQKVLGALLADEMKAIGIRDGVIDEDGYVYGSIPGDPTLPSIGLIAHMDTAPDASGSNVKPSIVSYAGGDILLNREKNIYLREVDYASLKRNRGKHLIVTDGTTLLGADDKAGVAEIMTAAERIISTGKKHATLKIAFTPDEEIGRGADKFDIPAFHADYAYTVDGGTIGELEYENFNAASAKVSFHGLGIHPGSAKGKMINAMDLAVQFHSMLPAAEKPEFTEGYEGFIHLCRMKGNVEQAELQYILRDHDFEKLCQKKQVMQAAAAYINAKYGMGSAEITITDSYENMKKYIEPHMYIISRAKEAMRKAGMEPAVVPVRGGTDGAQLSVRGLPCPNLCTGGENYHGRFEYIPVEDMEKCVEMLENILYGF